MLNSDLFRNKWKDKYLISWCELCHTAIIICPDCSNPSCSGGGCDKCIADQHEFDKTFKTRLEDYLDPDEIKIYQKCDKLKGLILDSIADGKSEVNFKELKEQGKFSEITEKLFEKEMNNG